MKRTIRTVFTVYDQFCLHLKRMFSSSSETVYWMKCIKICHCWCQFSCGTVNEKWYLWLLMTLEYGISVSHSLLTEYLVLWRIMCISMRNNITTEYELLLKTMHERCHSPDEYSMSMCIRRWTARMTDNLLDTIHYERNRP